MTIEEDMLISLSSIEKCSFPILDVLRAEEIRHARFFALLIGKDEMEIFQNNFSRTLLIEIRNKNDLVNIEWWLKTTTKQKTKKRREKIFEDQRWRWRKWFSWQIRWRLKKNHRKSIKIFSSWTRREGFLSLKEN